MTRKSCRRQPYRERPFRLTLYNLLVRDTEGGDVKGSIPDGEDEVKDHNLEEGPGDDVTNPVLESNRSQTFTRSMPNFTKCLVLALNRGILPTRSIAST